MFAKAPASAAKKPFFQRAHRPDYQLIVYIGILMLLGLVVMYAIGPQRAIVLNGLTGGDVSGTYFVIKQFVSLAVAIVAFAALVLMPLEVLKRNTGAILVVGLAACGILFVFGNLFHVEAIAHCTQGACRWFNLGPLGSFQPAELLKFGLLLFVARFLAQKRQVGLINNWQETLQPLLVITGICAVIVIIIQRDMGTGLSLLAIVASMLTVAGISMANGAKLLLGLLVVGVLMIVSAPHRMERVATFLRGDDSASSEANDEDYHIRQAKIAIGSGGMLGVGIGNSVQATGYLPETINDSMFAVLGEMFGFVGLTVLLIIMAALLMQLLKIADKLLDPWMQLVVVGVFGWLAAHIILNIASMIGIFPLTGITLPLLSFGGTSMIFITGALGMVFHLSRFTAHSSLIKEAAYADSNRGRGIRRTRDANRRRSK